MVDRSVESVTKTKSMIMRRVYFGSSPPHPGIVSDGCAHCSADPCVPVANPPPQFDIGNEICAGPSRLDPSMLPSGLPPDTTPYVFKVDGDEAKRRWRVPPRTSGT